MESLASVPASIFTQAASTQGSTFIRTSTVASMGGPIMSQSQSQTECQLPNSSTAIISSMAGSTTIHNNNNKVNAATTVKRCDSEGGKVSYVMETLQCDSEV